MNPIPAFIAVAVGLFVYIRLGLRIHRAGGKVRAGKLGIADLLMGSVFVCWFSLLILTSFGHDSHRVVHTRDLIQGASVEILIVALVCFFLRLRKVDLVELFGLREVALRKIPGMAVLLLLACYPLLGVAAVLSERLGGGGGEPQEIVQFFLDSSSKGDLWAAGATIVMGALVAPVAEELIFRGYIYAISKRYLGIAAGILVNSTLFAAIHLNQAALLPLFVLAVCFSLVYEATGSILVSMSMHSLFNLATFLLLSTIPHSVS